MGERQLLGTKTDPNRRPIFKIAELDLDYDSIIGTYISAWPVTVMASFLPFVGFGCRAELWPARDHGQRALQGVEIYLILNSDIFVFAAGGR
ncbi:MAG: hypothetical protein AB7P20_25140 [Rhizobiaceae bacterium]